MWGGGGSFMKLVTAVYYQLLESWVLFVARASLKEFAIHCLPQTNSVYNGTRLLKLDVSGLKHHNVNVASHQNVASQPQNVAIHFIYMFIHKCYVIHQNMWKSCTATTDSLDPPTSVACFLNVVVDVLTMYSLTLFYVKLSFCIFC